MASALDHLLNALDIALKSGDRAAAERAAEAERTRRKAVRLKGFGERKPATDPSCCIVKREGDAS